MDATEMRELLCPTPSPSGEAIREIVQVFEDGCRAAAALRRTASSRTANEIESALNNIELRMMWEIATICQRYAHDGTVREPRAAASTVTVQTYDPVADCFPETPGAPRN
jgi:hypothetical protein